MAVQLDFDYVNSSLSKGIDKLSDKIGAAVLMYCTTKAKELESQMKTNRPWTDRTNMAKVTLNAKVSQPNPNTIRITLAHGVEYGMWLELANEKNYAIVGPTVRNESPRVIRDMQDLLNKIKL